MIKVSHNEDLMLDNNYYYFDTLRAYVSQADGDATIAFYKKPDEILVHVTPSNQENRKQIIDNLLKFNRKLGLKIIFSKSLKISNTISYSLHI